MMIRVDRFFIEELQKNGYDIDFKSLKEIYKKSKENPGYAEAKAKSKAEHQRWVTAANDCYKS